MSNQLLTIEGIYDGKTKEQIRAAKNKALFYAITDEIRESLNRAGVTEEEMLADFSRFRRTLTRE